MDRRLAWALVPLPGLLLVWLLHAGLARLDAEARARVDDTLGVGDVVFGAPPPPGFAVVRRQGPMTVLAGKARWDDTPHPVLEATVSTYGGHVGRVTVFTKDPAVARRLRADLARRLGEPMKRREKAGGEGDRWIGRSIFVAYDERAGAPGGRVRMTDTGVARMLPTDPALEAEILTRE